MIKEHDQVLYREHGFGLDTGNYEIVAVLSKNILYLINELSS